MAASLHYPALRASHSALEPAGSALPLLRRLARLCLLAFLAELIWALFASPRLAIRTVELRGDDKLCADLASRPELQGHRLLPRTNFFLVSPRQLARRLSGVPAVRAVRVARDFPSRLIITVERREPAAVIRAADRALLVDAQGVVYEVRNEWGWGLPELVAPRLSRQSERGEKAVGADARAREELRALLEVLRVFSPYPQLGITRLELDDAGEVTARLQSGAEVKLGEPRQLSEKLTMLAAVLSQIGPERIAQVDLSDPAAAYWRPREPAEVR